VDNPWIETARVTRRLPNTIEFAVSEHIAAGLMLLDNALYLVNSTGQPIVAMGAEDSGDLPVVTGVTAEDVATDRVRALERVAEGLELIRRYQRQTMGKTYPPHEVHMAPDGSVDMVVGARGTTLKLGSPPFAQKLLMGGRVLGKVLARGEVPSIVFLDNEAHPERVVVRLR
jgi:cell division protein FtsQ